MVVPTQVLFEGSDMGVYAVGKKVLDFPTLRQTHEMTVEAVVTPLMGLLGTVQDATEIRRLFYEPVNRDLYPEK